VKSASSTEKVAKETAVKLKKFALAGLIVSKSSVARKILVEAVAGNKGWLIRQAQSVAIQLRRAGQ
jgi:hypothetical protein